MNDEDREQREFATIITCMENELRRRFRNVSQLEIAASAAMAFWKMEKSARLELEQSRSAVHFAGLVLKEHRGDGYCANIDGVVLQEHALKAGMLEERTVTEPCGLGCECQTCGSEFPTKCYFVTEAGRAAIEVAREKE